jgi:hypothetical protein
MSISMQRVKALLQQHGEDEQRFLLVREGADPAPSKDIYSFENFLTDAPPELRCRLGVCIDPGARNVQVIARLRDVHCERVLIIQTDGGMLSTDLLALGFQELATEDDCTLFIHSAEVTDRPREWNNAKHWAHPENFDKR